MAKLLFIADDGNNQIIEMDHIPRLGDLVPLFNLKLKVTDVLWFPELLFTEYEGKGLDVIITLDP